MTKADSVVVSVNFPIAEQADQGVRGHFQGCKCSAFAESACWSQEADARGRGEANSRGGWGVLSRKVAFALLLECLDVTWEDGRKNSSGWGHTLSQRQTC